MNDDVTLLWNCYSKSERKIKEEKDENAKNNRKSDNGPGRVRDDAGPDLGSPGSGSSPKRKSSDYNLGAGSEVKKWI